MTNYFTAVQQGRKRVEAAVSLLQEVAGPSYPMLFLKIGVAEWTPVGEELEYSIVQGKDATSAVVLCDADANSKAMSAWLPRDRVDTIVSTMTERKIPRHVGEVKLPI